jgi:hypothetical protein
LTKSLSTIQNLKELKLDLTTIDKVEIVLRNLPNLKILNGKAITPDLFSEESNDSKSLNKEIVKEKEEFEGNNNNSNIKNRNHLLEDDKIIIEKNELERDSYEQNEMELPDSNIESEIHNYDVSYILSNFKYSIENNATIDIN